MGDQTALFHEPTEPEKARMEKERMAKKRKEDLERLQREARHLVYCNHSMGIVGLPNVCCTDWVRKALKIETLPSGAPRLNNLNGAIFSGDRWVCLGKYQSKVKNSHGNRIGLWTMKEYVHTVRAAIASMDPAELEEQGVFV